MLRFDSRQPGIIGQRLLVAFIFCAIALTLQNALVPVSLWSVATLEHDAVILSYLLAWGSRCLVSDPTGFYNPPIFFPDKNVVQSTDALELPALLMTPLWALTKNPYLMGNVLVFLSHVFALTTSYYVARRHFRLNRWLSILIAVIFTASSDRLWHATGHFNLLWSGVIPLIWLFSWKMLDQPSWRDAGLFAVVLGGSIYFSVYFFVLSSICAGATVAVWLLAHGKWVSRRSLMLAFGGIIGGVVIALPKIIVYAWAASGVETVRNTLSEAALYSADWKGYLLPTQPESALARVIGANHVPGENAQFIGYFISVLLLCELIRLLRKCLTSKLSIPDKVSLGSFCAGAVLVLCSFGPNFNVTGFSPYGLLHHTFLKFTAFYRVPARLAFVSQWMLIISAATFLANWRFNAYGRASAMFAVAATFIVFMEHVPLNHSRLVKNQNRELLGLIDKYDATRKEAYIDIRPDLTLESALENIPNWRPTVNGWLSAALNPAFDQRALAFTTDFPSTGTIGWLATRNVPWVLLHDGEMIRKAEADGRLKRIGKFEGGSVFRIPDVSTAKAEFVQFRDQRVQELAALRSETPTKISWPETSAIQVVPDTASPFVQNFSISLTPSLSFPGSEIDWSRMVPPTYWHSVRPMTAFPPGIYDRITVQYLLNGSGAKHRAQLYWGVGPGLTATRRVKADVDQLESDAVWEAEFELSGNFNWMCDPAAEWLLIGFDRFKGAPPSSIKILKITFDRDVGISIPAIDEI